MNTFTVAELNRIVELVVNPDLEISDDFSRVALTGEQKMAMVESIRNGGTTAAKLAKKHNLKRYVINNWVRWHKRGKLLQSGAGRPKALDLPADQSVMAFVREEILPSRDELKRKIDDGYRETKIRRCADVREVFERTGVAPAVPSRTRRRYVNKYACVDVIIDSL